MERTSLLMEAYDKIGLTNIVNMSIVLDLNKRE